MKRRPLAARMVKGLLLAGAAILPGCAPTSQPMATPVPSAVVSPSPPSVRASATPIPPLRAETGDFPDRTTLLDPVCYEFLATLAGQTWLWTSQGDLDAFSERVAESELCPDAPRLTFDFRGAVLAGAVSTAIGCDAAHRVTELARDDSARSVTLRLAWETRPGCDYELLEPILVEVPAPPNGYALHVAIGGAG